MAYNSSYSGEQVDAVVGAVLSIGAEELIDPEKGIATYEKRIADLESTLLGKGSANSIVSQVGSINSILQTCLKDDRLNTITRPLSISVSKKETENNLETIEIDSSNKYLYPVVQIAPPDTMTNQVKLGEKALYYIQDASNSGYTLSIDKEQDNALAWHYYKNGSPEQLARITSKGQVYGAVWNDYAEFRTSNICSPGFVICETENGELALSEKRLQPCAHVITDTYGFAIGQTDEAQTPVAVCGRVLAFPNEKEKFKVGDCVCSGPRGTVSRMNRLEVILFPDRIIGTVSEIPTYDYWGLESVPVNSRIWINLK